ncbi:DDE-type integrase/transposase/recombinase (plasmid) [Mesorhizobium sp. AR02]|uniref:hypothetical protein n=1 Tax=Mesorhizobium sp. AR02 TaxID=2865837 RepID=UPI00215F9CF0|nr:hypothetical protein [Mesorhizobium sp. AR02]UVK49850.1 DDE-type integrase/transposase/recombinase [Mesorhizobium sp. AR02]
MTAVLLPRGTLVTYNDIAGMIDGRTPDRSGYWLRPIAGRDSGPTIPFPVSDRQIEAGYLDGSFREGADNELLDDSNAHLASVDTTKVSDRDEMVAAYRQRIVDAIEEELRSNPEGFKQRRKLFARIAASIPPPEGVDPVLGASVERHYKDYRITGCSTAALYPRHGWKGNREQRKPDFVYEAIELAIDNKYNGRGSLPDVQTEAISIARMNLPTDLSDYTRGKRMPDGTVEQVSMIPRREDGGIRWEELVSYAIIRRAIKKRSAIDRAIRILGPEEGKKGFRVVAAGPVETRALALGETDDCHLSRLFVVDDENWFPLGYPHFTAIIDVATRCIPGFEIGFMPPSSDSVGRCLRHAILPKDLSWVGNHPDGTPIIRNRYPMFGTFSELKCDQGGGFISGHTRDNAYRCGTSLTVLPPAAPQMKGHIERFFGTLKRSAFGRSIGLLPKALVDALSKSGKKGRRDPVVITLRELRLLLTFWIVEVYHQTHHSGIGMPPQEAWEIKTAQRFVPPPRPKREIDLLVGKYEPSRVINANGIRMFGLEYNSDALGALRERGAGIDGIMHGVEIKYDSPDISVVWALAEDPLSPGKTIAVPAFCKQMKYAKGLSEYQHIVIKAHARAKSKHRILSMTQLMEAKLDLARMAKEMIGERNASGGAVKLARHLNVNRAYLNNPEDIDDAEASKRFLALVDEEPIADDSAEASEPMVRKKISPPPSTETPDEAVAEPMEPLGTRMLAAEARIGRLNLGVIHDD